MSSLVQLWEQSYEFKEKELAFFAESQKKLSIPFTIPEDFYLSTLETEQSLEEIAAGIFIKEHLPSEEDTPHEARCLREKLTNRIQIINKLRKNVDDLSDQINNLQHSHEQVKNKSLVMQSLWDGLMTRQEEQGEVITKLKDALKPYMDYSKLQTSITQMSDNNGLDPNFISDVNICFEHFSKLLSTKDHFDAPLYISRYQVLCKIGINGISSAFLKELEEVTRSSSIRFRTNSADLSLMADVTADFLLTVDKLSSPFHNLIILPQMQEFQKVPLQIVQKYFACRSSLLHHFISNWTFDDHPEKGIPSLIEFTLNQLRQENNLAERLLTLEFSTFSPQYRQFCESFLIPVLKIIREQCESTLEDLLSLVNTYSLATLDRLRPVSILEEQQRLQNILRDYFNTEE